MNLARDYTPSLDPQEEQPLFLQLARALTRDIRAGRLRPGTRLPGTRELAQRVGVHRNTALSAYAELEQQGWITTARARGTFVAQALPERTLRRPPKAEPTTARPCRMELPAFELDGKLQAPDVPLPLVGGMPDLRLIPREALARAYRRALKAPAALGYQNERGDSRLIHALREMLGTQRGVLASEDELIVTRGSQMALHLAARAICAPGDLIAVEAFGYKPAWDGFRLAGAELVPVPVDRGGMRLDVLAQLAETRRLRAVYVTPHHQYPTTVTMQAARRLQLLALAERERLFVLEDDYDHEFHWSGRPVLPLASADPARVVIYSGTLSKVFAPGIRIGYLIARAEVIERVARLRARIDRQGDQVVERAVAELIEEGELQRHARKVRRLYAERRECLHQLLTRELGGALEYELPPGGLAFWAKFHGAGGVERFAQAALERGVALQTAQRFSFDRKARDALRIGFPALTPEELRRAVKILATALRESSS